VKAESKNKAFTAERMENTEKNCFSKKQRQDSRRREKLSGKKTKTKTLATEHAEKTEKSLEGWVSQAL